MSDRLLRAFERTVFGINEASIALYTLTRDRRRARPRVPASRWLRQRNGLPVGEAGQPSDPRAELEEYQLVPSLPTLPRPRGTVLEGLKEDPVGRSRVIISKYRGAMLGLGLGSSVSESRTSGRIFPSRPGDSARLALCLAQSIVDHRGLALDDFARRVKAFRHYAHGPPVAATSAAIEMVLRRAPWYRVGAPVDDAEAAVRATVVALLHGTASPSMVDEVTFQSVVTHADRRSLAAAVAQSLIITLLIDTEPHKLNSAELLEAVVAPIEGMYFGSRNDGVTYDLLLALSGADPNGSSRRIPLVRPSPSANALGGALGCFLASPEDPERSMETAVAADATGIVGALTGAMVGAYHGLEAFPDGWRRGTSYQDCFVGLADALVELSEIGVEPPTADDRWDRGIVSSDYDGHWFLSDLAYTPFEYEGVVYPTLQHAFRTTRATRPELAEIARLAPTPGDALAVPAFPELHRWDYQGRWRLLRHKFLPGTWLADRLVEMSAAELERAAPAGVSDPSEFGSEANIFGMRLADIRRDLVNATVPTDPFKVGEFVAHPHHGAVRIIQAQRSELGRETTDYLVLEIASDHQTVLVPVAQAVEFGLRSVMTKAEAQHIVQVLADVPVRRRGDLSSRLLDKQLHSRDPIQVAMVIRDLTHHRRTVGISPSWRRMLDRARLKLRSELQIALDMDEESFDRLIDEALEASAASGWEPSD